MASKANICVISTNTIAMNRTTVTAVRSLSLNRQSGISNSDLRIRRRPFYPISIGCPFILSSSSYRIIFPLLRPSTSSDPITTNGNALVIGLPLVAANTCRRFERNSTSRIISMLPANPMVGDVLATVLSGAISLSMLRIWEETAKRGLFNQKLNRKLVHITVGLVFMLCWPLFSSGSRGAVAAALIPGINVIKMLLLGLGIWKDEATVKSMSRFGDYRELLRGPLYYASTITLACAIYWRTSPIAIAATCNLCAGDGFADIIGRQFGDRKLPYNRHKSFAGSFAMVIAGFSASVVYMYYFSIFGFIQPSQEMALSFFIISLVATFVESLPISSELDDNLTVPLTSIILGTLLC